MGLARLWLRALPDSLTTGSSIMPQKRNPDAAELASKQDASDAFAGLLTVVKAALARQDLQRTKACVRSVRCSRPRLLQWPEWSATNQYRCHAPSYRAGYPATDLADWLVKKLNKPFREAHHIAGRSEGGRLGSALDALPLAELQRSSPRSIRAFIKSFARGLSPLAHELRQHSAARVKNAVAFWKEQLR